MVTSDNAVVTTIFLVTILVSALCSFAIITTMDATGIPLVIVAMDV